MVKKIKKLNLQPKQSKPIGFKSYVEALHK